MAWHSAAMGAWALARPKLTCSTGVSPGGGVPERVFEAPGGAEDGVGGLHAVIEGRGAERAGGREFLVGEGDAEAAAVVFADLGVGPGERGPVAVAGDIHGPDVEAGIAVGHPAGQRQADAAALAEAGHDAAGDPVVGQAADRADEGVAVCGEGEGAVDDALDAGLFQPGEVAEADLEVAGDAVEVRRQEFGLEVPRRGDGGPGDAFVFVGAEEDAAAFLTEVDFAFEVDGVGEFAIRQVVDVLGDEVLVLHGEDGEFEANHAADFAGPEAAGVDDVLGDDGALVGHHVPEAVGAPVGFEDAGAAVDFGPGQGGAFGVGVGDAGGVDMAFQRVPHGADELGFVEQRQEFGGFVDGDEFGVHAEIGASCGGHLEPVHAVPGAGEHDAAGHVDAAGLAGDAFDLGVELDGIFLQLGDVGVAVQRVHAAGGVPGGAAGEFVAFEQDHVLPAELGEVVQHGAADHAAADDCRAHMGFHGGLLRPGTWRPG